MSDDPVDREAAEQTPSIADDPLAEPAEFPPSPASGELNRGAGAPGVPQRPSVAAEIGPGPTGGKAAFGRLLAALWLGSGAFLMLVAAPAAFRASDTPVNAANVVGAMLNRWHYLALLVPIVLLLIRWRWARARVFVLLITALLCASAQAGIDLRIRAIRSESIIAISALPREHPIRRRFGMLHGASSMLLLVQVLAAAGVVAERDTP